MIRDGPRGNQKADAIYDARRGCDDARTAPVLPQAADDSANAEKCNGQREGQRNRFERPVFGCNQRFYEDAPAVYRAQADLHDHGGDGDKPAISELVGHRCSGRFYTRWTPFRITDWLQREAIYRKRGETPAVPGVRRAGSSPVLRAHRRRRGET